MKIAIHQNKEIFDHSITWEKVWIDYCGKNKISYEIVDCFRTDIIEKLQEFDSLVWHFQNYVLQEMMFARSILNVATKMGLKVFPDFNTAWHFDDKISEMYLLQSINAPIPKSWVFSTEDDCIHWINNYAEFPIIAKLKCGAGSHNVQLIKSGLEAKCYVRKMFGKGLSSSPNIIFKASSNLKSSKSWKTIVSRIKKIPEFLQTLDRSKRFGNEKDYSYFQEFIPNDGFDLKVVVIGDKLSFIARNIRKGDFRASGGGSFSFDRSLVPDNVIKSAFEISDKLGFQCMGYDYVIDKNSNEGKIVEISYAFSHTVLLGAGGYWNRDLEWFEEPLNIPNEIIDNLLLKSE